jgi:NADPH:quinone reductase-like Zn-dependent oxidoreductase
VPETVGWPEAGGFVEVFATAHDALFTQAQLMPGERLLVNGAAGGVGSAAVQLGSEAGRSSAAPRAITSTRSSSWERPTPSRRRSTT